MIRIQTFCVNPVAENTYLLTADGEAAIVDCGCFSPSEWQHVKNALDESGCRLKALLQTHLHFDHVLGAQFALHSPQSEGTEGELPLLASPNDEPLLKAMEAQITMFLGRQAVQQFDLSFIDKGITPLADGDTFTLGESTLHVLATPGHSRGGLCFYSPEEGLLFSGDTLFRGSIGRTDLAGGNFTQLMQSLHRLSQLPPETVVFPGHGPATTLADEAAYNPYLRL